MPAKGAPTSRAPGEVAAPLGLVSLLFASRRSLISLAKAGLYGEHQPQVLVHGHPHSQGALNLSSRLPFSPRCDWSAAFTPLHRSSIQRGRYFESLPNFAR
jgi:hypothetical protein